MKRKNFLVNLTYLIFLKVEKTARNSMIYFPFAAISTTLTKSHAKEVNVSDFGAVGNGLFDDTKSFCKTLKYASEHNLNVVLSSRKKYRITESIKLYSNTKIDGEDAVIFFDKKPEKKSDSIYPVFHLILKHNISIKNIIFECSSSIFYGIVTISCSNINITSCKTRGASLLHTGIEVGMEYDDVTPQHMNANIVIQQCEAIGNNDLKGEGCIFLAYTNNFSAIDNKINRYVHGIVWWGGDSNHQRHGLLKNKRKCASGVISKNYVDNINGGGIWGSMGENIDVVSNRVSNCGDVGIDSEGSFSISIHKNFVKNCSNGCVSTFFYNKNINIFDNSISSDVADQFLLKINNSAQTFDNKNITIRNNTFTFLGKTGFAKFGGDCCETILVCNNKFTNTAISLLSNNNHYLEISRNLISYDRPMHSSTGYISVGGTNNNGLLYLLKNKISFDSPLDSVSFSIYINQFDFNSSSKNFISGNFISGFSKFIHLLNSSLNPGITPKFYIENNIFEKTNKILHGKIESCVTRSSSKDCGTIYIKRKGRLSVSWENNQSVDKKLVSEI